MTANSGTLSGIDGVLDETTILFADLYKSCQNDSQRTKRCQWAYRQTETPPRWALKHLYCSSSRGLHRHGHNVGRIGERRRSWGQEVAVLVVHVWLPSFRVEQEVVHRRHRSPREEALVGRLLHDFLLEPPERLATLPVYGGHVHVEDAHERVGLVLDACRLSVSSPRHTARDTNFMKLAVECEDVPVDARNVLEKPGPCCLRPKRCPILCEEYNASRREELLKRPAASEPLASSECGAGGCGGRV